MNTTDVQKMEIKLSSEQKAQSLQISAVCATIADHVIQYAQLAPHHTTQDIMVCINYHLKTKIDARSK